MSRQGATASRFSLLAELLSPPTVPLATQFVIESPLYCHAPFNCHAPCYCHDLGCSCHAPCYCHGLVCYCLTPRPIPCPTSAAGLTFPPTLCPATALWPPVQLLWHLHSGSCSLLQPYLAQLPGRAAGVPCPLVGALLSDEAAQELQYMPLRQDVHNQK